MRLKRAALGAALAASVGCGSGPTAAPAAQGFPPAAVKVAVVKSSEVEDATEYVATLKSLHSTTIQPQVDGQITRIEVKSGDRVKQGQPLVQIDPRRQQAAVSSQEAERAAKEASVAWALQELKRATELYAAGAVSKQELERAQTGVRTAEADLRSHQAQVQQQEVQLRYYTISAPRSGIVGDIPVRVGNIVTPQTVLTTIDQNETLELYVSVPVERSRDLKNGLPIQVLTSDGQQRFGVTRIAFISPHVDETTQSVLVKATVRNPDLVLRAQQFVRARIIFKTTPGLVIPVTAVSRISGQYFAFVAEEAKDTAGGAGRPGPVGLVAKQRAVKLGPIVGDDYTVLEGLKPGERVVVSGVQKLADGAPIQPQTNP